METDVDRAASAAAAAAAGDKSTTMTDEVASSCWCERGRMQTAYNNRQNVTRAARYTPAKYRRIMEAESALSTAVFSNTGINKSWWQF